LLLEEERNVGTLMLLRFVSDVVRRPKTRLKIELREALGVEEVNQ
jgi:hypothetical protein